MENGRDNLTRDDLGGDIHIDNPAEELNLFARPAQPYGYPFCFSELIFRPDRSWARRRSGPMRA